MLRDPFQTLDASGVGQLVEMAVKKAAARSGLKCGICGEHGGDPDSIVFCHKVGLDYVPAARSACRSHGWRRLKRR